MHSYDIKNPNLSVELIHEIVNFLPFDIKWEDFRVSLIFDYLLLKNQRHFIILSKCVKKIINILTQIRQQYSAFSVSVGMGNLTYETLNTINDRTNYSFHSLKFITTTILKYNFNYLALIDSYHWPPSYFPFAGIQMLRANVHLKLFILDQIMQLSINTLQNNFQMTEVDVTAVRQFLNVIEAGTREINISIMNNNNVAV